MLKLLFSACKGALFLIFFPLLVFSVDSFDAIHTGKLENGLTYYVVENPESGKRISLRLLIKAGSVLEEERERGIAHFVEHMAFKGSKNFPSGTVVKTLESFGAAFGSEANAFTSFDYTEYKIDLPLGKRGALHTAFLALSDWAFRSAIDTVEVERERGVILDEYRRKQSETQDIKEYRWKLLTEGSPYENRKPIGVPSVIREVSSESIKNFYKKWYRPERMAVIVEGDIRYAQAEDLIRRHFNESMGDGKQAVSFPSIPINREVKFALGVDERARESSIALVIRGNSNAQDKNGVLFDDLLSFMMNERMEEISLDSSSPFVFAKNFISQPLPFLHVNKFHVKSLREDTGRAIQFLLEEIRNIREKGFFESELNRAKSNMELKRDLILNDGFLLVKRIEEFFLKGPSHMDFSRWMKDSYKKMSEATIEEANFYLRDILDLSSFVMSVSTSNKNISVEDLKGFYRSVGNSSQPLYRERGEKDFSFGRYAPGKIIEKKRRSKANIVEYTLQNGMRVFIKPTKLKRGEILVKGYAKGGIASLGRNFFPSKIVENSLEKSFKVAGLDFMEWKRLLSGKLAGMELSLGTYSRQIQGVTRKQDVQKALQLVHLFFTDSYNEKEIFRALLKKDSQGKDFYKALEKEGAFDDYFQALSHFYRGCFKNPADFTFFIVGDFDEREMEKNVEVYFASIPQKKKKTAPFKGIKIPFFKKAKHASARGASFGMTRIDVPFCLENVKYAKHRLSSVAQIIASRLTETLRREMGATYHVGVGCGDSSFENQSTLSVSFSCDKKDEKKLIRAVFEELYSLKAKGARKEELDAVKAIQWSRNENNLCRNEYWARSLLRRHRLGFAPEGILAASEVIRSLSLYDIQAVIKRMTLAQSATVFSLPSKERGGVSFYSGSVAAQ